MKLALSKTRSEMSGMEIHGINKREAVKGTVGWFTPHELFEMLHCPMTGKYRRWRKACRRLVVDRPGVNVAHDAHRAVVTPARQLGAVRGEAHGIDGTRVAGQGLPRRLAGGRRPQPRRLVIRRGGQLLAVRREAHGIDPIRVARQGLPQSLAGGRRSQPRRLVSRRGGLLLAIRREAHRPDRTRVGRQGLPRGPHGRPRRPIRHTRV